MGKNRARQRVQYVRLILLRDDIKWATVALGGYKSANKSILQALEKHQFENLRTHNYSDEVFYHAINFVCAMRRVGRNLEELSSIFSPPVSDTIKLEWRQKRTMLESYKEPRNAIEHVLGDEVRARAEDHGTSWILYNLDTGNNVLRVTEEGKHKAEISEANLRRVQQAFNNIVNLLEEKGFPYRFSRFEISR